MPGVGGEFDIAVIGGGHAGVEAARAAKLRVLAVTNTVSANELTRADRVVASLAEIGLQDLAELVARGGCGRPSTRRE